MRGLLRWAVGLAVMVACGWHAEAQRLPGGVTPEHYSLTIAPDLQAGTFTGSESIEVVLARPTRAITLNAAEIEFGGVRAWPEQGRSASNAGPSTPIGTGVPNSAQDDTPEKQVTRLRAPRSAQDDTGSAGAVSLDAKAEQATLTFPKELPAGRVTLAIEFKGKLNNKLRGFYLSKWKNRSFGVTQFEATDARRAFPCFDEPALKATFDVRLIVDEGDTAFSNTKVLSDKGGPTTGKHTLTFATTPRMSTYLVAWVVGQFKCTKGKSDGVPIRACATPDNVKLTKFALQAAKQYLAYYDSYFGIRYPMGKLDLIAIPDFEAGAMENFGCITFRETELLVDKKNGTLVAKKEVAETVAHEMAHQWFGDLVTPAWWDNLWLNEGFATWMETKAAAAWHPEWHYGEEVATEQNSTMDDDAGGTTRPIRARAETPDQINELFDDIAYGKAGAVIGMVENWVGEEVFRKGVQAYLSEHLYGNATAADFWNAQARTSGMPVDKVMSSFVEQPGVPLVTVASDVLTQSRLRFAADDPANAERWSIPVCLKGDGCDVLAPDSAGEPLPSEARGASVLYADAADKGYYRTQYPAAEWKKIVARAESSLTAEERIGLLGDRWALMRAGKGTVGDFLDLVFALKTDSSATVIDAANARLRFVETWIANDEDRRQLNKVVQREFGPVYTAMGPVYKHEPYDHADLRVSLFEVLGRARDPRALAEADNLSAALFAGQKTPDPMKTDVAVVLAAPEGNQSMYDRLLGLIAKTKDPDLKQAALNVLTRFHAPELVERTLQYAVSEDVRSQDSWMLIALLLTQRETQDQAWRFVQAHWAEIKAKSTENSGARLVEAAGSFCTVEKRDEVAKFFGEHPVGSAERTLAKSLDSIDGCVRLRQSEEPDLRRWLEAH